MKHFISHEPEDRDAWICLCGNTSSADGFCPIDYGINEVEPTEKDWTTGHLLLQLVRPRMTVETEEVPMPTTQVPATAAQGAGKKGL